MLTVEAFNALLKTLEEPPKRSVFILCTTELHKIPETIRSRCQVFKMKKATMNQIVTRLGEIANKEGAEVAKDDLKKIAAASAGGFRDADTILQQIIEGNLDINTFIDLELNRQVFVDFVYNLLSSDADSAFRQVSKLLEDGKDLTSWVTELLKYLRDMLLLLNGVESQYLDSTEELLFDIKKQKELLDSEKLVKVIELFLKAQLGIKGSSIPSLPVELAIVQSITILGSPGKVYQNPKPIKPADTNEVPTKETTKQENFIELKIVEEKWGDVVKASVAYNHSLNALLKSSRPVKTEGSKIVLEVFYAFHKERLEDVKNRKIVEKVLTEVFNMNLTISCVQSVEKPVVKSKQETGLLTDYNIIVPVDKNASVLDIFDGGLPLGKK